MDLPFHHHLAYNIRVHRRSANTNGEVPSPSHTAGDVPGPSSNHIHMTNREYDHHYEGPYNPRHVVSGDGDTNGHDGRRHSTADGRRPTDSGVRHANNQHDGTWHSPQDEIEDLSLHHAAGFGDTDNTRLLLTGMLKTGGPDPMVSHGLQLPSPWITPTAAVS